MHHRNLVLIFLPMFTVLAGCGDKSVSEQAGETTAIAVGAVEEAVDAGIIAVTENYDEASRGIDAAAEQMQREIERAIDDVPLAQRQEKCAQEKGMWAERVLVSPCENGRATLTVDSEEQVQTCDGGTGGAYVGQCVHRTLLGSIYFNDGPSIPHELQALSRLAGEKTDLHHWNDVFWEAAVNHDYCYHHGHATYGYTQRDCDNQFLQDLMSLCKQNPARFESWYNGDNCIAYAHVMYTGVRSGGAEAYAMVSTKVAYPEYTPMWQTLNLEGQPTDDDLRRAIDGFMD